MASADHIDLSYLIGLFDHIGYADLVSLRLSRRFAQITSVGVNQIGCLRPRLLAPTTSPLAHHFGWLR